MLLDRILAVVVDSRRRPVLWLRLLRIAWTLIYHIVIALCNPTDRLGEDFGSVSIVTGTVRSAVLLLSKQIDLGPLILLGLKTRVALGFTFGWRGSINLTVEQLDCDLAIPDCVTKDSSSGIRTHNNQHRAEDPVQGILSMYDKIAKFLGYLSVFTVTLKEVNITINDEIQLRIGSLGSKLTINTKEKEVLAEGSLNGVALWASSGPAGSAEKVPLLQLSTAAVKAKLHPIGSGTRVLEASIGDCFLGLSQHNHQVLLDLLLAVVSHLTAPLNSTCGDRFEHLMQRFAAIDRCAAAAQAYAAAESISVQECAHIWDDCCDEMHFVLAPEAPVSSSGGDNAYSVILSAQRLGVILCASSPRYPDQVVSLCDIEANLSHNPRPVHPTGTAESVMRSIAADGYEVVKRFSVAVGAVKTCQLSQGQAAHGQHLLNLRRAAPDSVGVSALSERANVTGPHVTFQYEVLASKAETERGARTLGPVLESTVSAQLAPLDLSLSAPALAVALHMVSECAAAVDCLGKYGRAASLSSGGGVGSGPASQEAVRLRSVDMSASFVRLDLSCPRATVDAFRRHVNESAAASPVNVTEAVNVTLRDLTVTASAPTLQRSSAGARGGAMNSVQQLFLSAPSIVVTSLTERDDQRIEREIIRIGEVSVTKIAAGRVAAGRGLVAPACTAPGQFEAWASAELDRCARKEAVYASEVTVQVGVVDGTINQQDLLVLGTMTGLLSTGTRLYQPQEYHHLSPLVLLDTTSTATSKCYVVVLSTSLQLQLVPDSQQAEIEGSSLHATTVPVTVYRLLQDAQLSYNCHCLGRLYAKSSAWVQGEIVVSRAVRLADGTVQGYMELARLAPVGDDSSWDGATLHSVAAAAGLDLAPVSGRRMCLFTSKSMLNECHKTSGGDGHVAVGVEGSYVNVTLPQLLVALDMVWMDPLCQLVRSYSLGGRIAEQIAFQHLARTEIDATVVPTAVENPHMLQLSAPNSITAVHIEYMKINMYHDQEPVLSLTSRKTDVHMLTFGPTLSQTVVVTHSLRLFELTAKYAVHTCIIGDVDASLPNRMEMHITSREGECSLMELQWEQLRLFYIQRSIMVLISYLRDHFITGIYASLSTATPLAECEVVPVVWGPSLPPPRGMVRFSVIFLKSEVHLPLNSCSTDAIVIIVDTTLAYRTFPVAVTAPQLTAYCKGPYNQRRLWISEIKNSRRVMHQLFAEKAVEAAAPGLLGGSGAGEAPVSSGGSALSQLFGTLPTSPDLAPSIASVAPVQAAAAPAVAAVVKWNLPHQAAELLIPLASVPFNTYPEFCLDLAVLNSNICSWCDANAVAEDISLTGKYALIPIPPGPDGEERSKIWVDVVAQEIEWVLSQGQYLSIINLIQQNFCELQELVPDIWPLPPPKTVQLSERLYGKYGLDSTLPILSTVPIHIAKGSITAVESTTEYFELFCTPLPPPHFPYGLRGHDLPPSAAGPYQERAFVDTIPAYTKHVYHRNRMFARMAAAAGSRGDKSGGSVAKSRTPRARQPTAEAARGESIIGVLFERLEIDFFRLHEGGGNGIEVSAGTFVIVGIDDRAGDDDDLASVHSLNLDELSLDSIIFAPRCFPILNSGGNTSVFASSASAGDGKKKSSSASFGTPRKGNGENGGNGVRQASPDCAAAEAEGESTFPPPHITYSQQGTQNLRRCVVTITDSMAVANIAKVLHAVEYFLKPVHVNTHRSLYAIAQCGLGPYDFKIGLDMEVHVNNTVVCLTNISRRDGASALCFHVNLDYTQTWRGFLSSGPGKTGLKIDISVANIYIAPMREINSNRIQSLVDPCVLVIGQDLMTHPPERTLQQNLALLTPWMRVGKWVQKVNKSDLPSTTRIVKFKVAPAKPPAAAGAAEDGAAAADEKRKRRRRKKQRGESADSTEVGSSSAAGSGGYGTTSQDEGDELEDGSGSSGEDDEDGSDSDGDGDGDDNGDEDGAMRARDNGDAYYSGTETSRTPTVRIQISTKDIYFIATAVKQARTALNKRLIITATEPDHFKESKSMLQDIAHLPQLTYYLVATPLENPSRKNRNNELLAEICDFEAVLRNNTYNLNILRVNVFDNCMLYTRSPQLLHMASGSAFAMWAYNEATDLWEPLVEPVNLRAIGATDESIHAAGMRGPSATGSGAEEGGKRSGAKIRIEVVTDPVELNVPQTALGHLIRKLSLADVVTTSSIHLPPYKVINELGVDVKFAIGMGESIITEKEIESGRSLPVEVQQLAEALEAFKARRNMTAKVAEDNISHKEYVMGITFPNFRDIYCSRVPLPIDKVGVHTYDMFNTGQKIPDPSGTDVQFDRRRISMGGVGSQKVGMVASIAIAAAAAAQLRKRSPKRGAEEGKSGAGAASSAGIADMEDGEVSGGEAASAKAGGVITPAASAVSLSTASGGPAVAVDVLDAGSVQMQDGVPLQRSDSVDVRYESPEGDAPPDASVESSPRTPVRGTTVADLPMPTSPPPSQAEVAAVQDPGSPARPTLFRRNSLTSAAEPIKFVQEVPLVVMEMRIKADGVREILLRSILSFKNNTSRIFQLSVRLYGSSVETSLAPGREWFVPVRFVNPKASLYIRLDERSNWFEALSSMQGLIVQGYWGDPSRLRAHLCACPAETVEPKDGSNGWILLIKPEVRDVKGQMQGSTGKIYVPVRYPTKEAYLKALKEGINSLEVNTSGQGGASGGGSASSGPTIKSRGAKAQPMCIQLLAPLQLCNLIPQPLLYRLADADGLITSEGVLLPGEMVDIHSICKLFVSRIFISVRMLNYCWSKWTLVFSRTNPFATTEHNTELTLTSLSLVHNNKEMTLPTVDISMLAREYLIRFSCSVLISNRTGLLLDLCESSSTDCYVPHSSRTSAEAFLPVPHKHHHHHHKRTQQVGVQSVNETPSMSERASFRRQRTASTDRAFGGMRTGGYGGGNYDGGDLEDAEDLDDEAEDDESVSSSSSGRDSTSRSGAQLSAAELSDEGLSRRGSFTLDGADGEGDESGEAVGAGAAAGVTPSSKRLAPLQDVRQVGTSPLRERLSSRPLPSLPITPFTPTDGDSGEPTRFGTPATGMSAGASRPISTNRSSRIVNLIVHLPYDHLRQVEVAASSDWTLLEVFRKVKQRLASATAHQSAANYVFFPWENGKLGPRKVDNSLIIEAQQQYENAVEQQQQQQAGGTSAGNKAGLSKAAAEAAMQADGTNTKSIAVAVPKERPVSMFSRERSTTNTSSAPPTKRGAADTEVPAPMQFEMLADCSLSPLAMTSRVDALQGTRLRLCHVAEWAIYKQAKSIRTEVIEKEGLFSSMFSRPKCTHTTALVPFEGDIPFKPHRMMGFNPSLSLRVPAANTEWSDAVDVIKGDFDSSELCIVASAAPPAAVATGTSRLSMRGAPPSIAAQQPPSLTPPVYYEFGACLERGRGFLHHVTTVTLVPKHVLVSRLSFAIQIRQIAPSAECEPLTLLPGTLCSYHFPTKSKSKLLQIRKVTVAAPDQVQAGSEEVMPAGEWLAELDICKIGVLYAKLRDPVQIVKAQIDSVGASLVVTLTEQSILWPPYRIDNMTAMEVRFRQVVDPAALSASRTGISGLKRAPTTGSLVSSKAPLESIAEGSAGAGDGSEVEEGSSAGASSGGSNKEKSGATSLSQEPLQLPWDHLETANSAPFAWDLPFTGKKAIQLEVKQLASSWVPCEVCLDDDDKPPPVVVKKAAPSLGNPFAEGFLLRQDANGDSWTKVYCILRPDVLYVYPDETRDYLIQVINLSVKHDADASPQLAFVSRYVDKRRTGTMGWVMGAAAKQKAIDINKTRCMMLKIAESLGLFSNVTEHSFLKKSRSSSEAESDSGAGAGDMPPALSAAAVPEAIPAAPLVVLPSFEESPAPSQDTEGAEVVAEPETSALELLVTAAVVADETPSSPRPPAQVTFDLPAEDSVGQPAAVAQVEGGAVRSDSVDWSELMEGRDTFSNMPHTPAAVPTADRDQPAPATVNGSTAAVETAAEGVSVAAEEDLNMRESVGSRKARFSSAPGNSLLTLLGAKISVEELLEEIAAVPVRVSEIIDALVVTKLVDKPERARETVEWMLAEGLLKPKATRRVIDGSAHDTDMTEAEMAEAAEAAAEKTATGADALDEDGSDEDADERADQFPAPEGKGRGIGGQVGAGGAGAGAGLRTSMTVPSRLSVSRQTSWGRASVSGDEPTDLGARKSVVSLGRRRPALTKIYEDVDLFMCPPPLNPEMLAMLDSFNDDNEPGQQQASSAGASSSAGAAQEAEVYGFTIVMEGAKHHFKCSTEMEFFGWIQACRQSIELLWVEHLLGLRKDKKAVSLEDYQATILLRLRADGSTKVLEIMQDDENITKEARNKSKSRMRGGRRNTVSSAEAIGKLSRVIRNSHLAPSLVPADAETKEFNREKELISVLFTVQSVALSVINAEPSELLYLSLRGIEMTVERSFDLVKFSGTVTEIQLSNQLLDPEFAVALFPRRMQAGHSGRLMLPGLNQSRTTFPSLHLYIQQRYHQSISDVGNPAAADSFEEDSHLHYFEMFTLWISPMQLDVDEEIIVKCIRYARGLKDVIYDPSLGRGAESKDDLLSLQQLGSKAWEGHADRRAVFELYVRLLEAGKVPYQTYSPSAKSSTGIYLSLLQLHPIDVVMSFRPSPNLVVTNSELAMISIISQLDSARLCLNALIAEHAFGSPAVLGRVLVKHYKAAFWRQFHKLIGSADIVEGSVGLVANLGSGVYDLFYEPIDGLLDENGSFLAGLSKGGASLAARTIGGTSAFTSQITGGLGKGVSLLTLDSQFQRNRAYRRFNKTTSVSEGLYVGTQELGKNIVEGVTGIVVSPYRGWETGGGVGLGMGLAKGILGVALKPAVGVFDLASRATEGLRNTAFTENQDALEERYGIYRKRIPRAFGRNGQIALYDPKAAAAQYVSDSVTLFKPEPRLQVVHHLYIRRKLQRFAIPGVMNPSPEKEDHPVPVSESWGFPLGRTYLVLVGQSRIVLAELSDPEKSTSTRRVPRWRQPKVRRFIWSCPANCIDQLFSDPNGDLIVSIGNSALISGPWNSPCPVVLDNQAQNFVIFQSLLEQTIGHRRARRQPLNPTEGLIQADIRKRYSSGIKSYLLSPSNHTYRLCGHVLYEYSDTAVKKAALKAEGSGAAATAAESAEGAEKPAAAGTAEPAPATAKSEVFIDQMISRIFPTSDPNPVAAAAAAAAAQKAKGEPSLDDMYVSFIYPLADLYIAGPTPEDAGRFYSITLSRLDGQKMRVLKSEEEQEHLSEYLKNSLSLIFARQDDAAAWKRALEDAMLWNLEEDELVPPGPLTTEDRRKQGRTLMTMARGGDEVVQPLDNSILGMLVLPTSGCKAEQTETIKIEIAKTLSSTRWR